MEGGDYCSPIRDGPGLRFGVIWKRYVSVVTHRRALHRHGTILFKGSNDTVEQPRERMEDPIHVTLNTSLSTMSPSVDNASGPNTAHECSCSNFLICCSHDDSPPFCKALAKLLAVVAVTGLNLIELG